MKCNFKIYGGKVFDSLSGTFHDGDVYISDGQIVEGTRYDGAQQEIDATGKYVLPGLIDEHAHLNLHGSMIGANADTVCIPNCVTTAVDGGTTGSSGFELFYSANITHYDVSVFAYLHVSTFGNKSLCLHEEDHDPADFREDLILRMFKKYPETLRGLKVRLCKATLGGYGLSPLKRAVEIAQSVEKECGRRCPVAVHYDNLPENVTVAGMLEQLRAGDIVAHIFQGKGETIFNDDGSVKKCVKEAQKRGVLMDDCHGRVHWSFANLKKAFTDGFFPDIISSDLVRISEYTRPGFSLNYAMSALSAAGMPLEKILKAVTLTPAKALGIFDRAGMLEPGHPADIAIMDISEHDMVLKDNYGGSEKVKLLFVPLMTMKEGRVAYRQIFF